MRNNGVADFIKPAIFTAQMYGKKVTIELDHCDLDMNELFEVFRSIALSHGFSEEGFENQIKDMADIIREDEEDDYPKPNEALKEAAERYIHAMKSDNFEDYQNKND